VLTTLPENLNALDSVSKIVTTRKAPAVVPMEVISVGIICSCTHVIADIVTDSKQEEGWNEQWIDNSHIDLVTWSDAYNY